VTNLIKLIQGLKPMLYREDFENASASENPVEEGGLHGCNHVQ
jgi:hypothetical protein